jgi:hypothetical protein
VIAYQLAGRKMRRGIRPDGFFVIRYLKAHEGKWFNRRMLLEMDMRTEDNPRFGREKAVPGIAYLRSEAYKQRFGYQSGRWLVVTTGERRMLNMKRQTEAVLGKDAGAFYFTWFDRVNAGTVLTAPIWYKGGEDTALPLFPVE